MLINMLWNFPCLSMSKHVSSCRNTKHPFQHVQHDSTRTARVSTCCNTCLNTCLNMLRQSCCNMSKHVATWTVIFQHVETWFNIIKHDATCCKKCRNMLFNILQYVVFPCLSANLFSWYPEFNPSLYKSTLNAYFKLALEIGDVKIGFCP